MSNQENRPVYRNTPTLESLIGPAPAERESADDAITKKEAIRYIEALEIGDIVGNLFPVEYNRVLQLCITKEVYIVAANVLAKALEQTHSLKLTEEEVANIAVQIAIQATLSIEESHTIDLGQRMNRAILDFIHRIAQYPAGRAILRDSDTETLHTFSEEIENEKEAIIGEIPTEALAQGLFDNPDFLASIHLDEEDIEREAKEDQKIKKDQLATADAGVSQ